LLQGASIAASRCDIVLYGKANLNPMAGLFERGKSVVFRHLGNVFKTSEFECNSIVAFFATPATDGG
jgi:hypothetical protein